MDLKETLVKIKNSLLKEGNGKKNLPVFIILIMIGILLILISNSFKGTSGTTSVSAVNVKENEEKVIETTDEDYELLLQKELEHKLEKIEGVGTVEVMIYFESGEEKVPAVNITNSNSVTNEEDTSGGKRKVSQNNNDKNVVVTNDDGDNKPLILKKNKPKVTGVLIVAKGAENKITELRITKAVSALFNLSREKVNVYPMEK
ncbi:stage III sporulation protein AG [Haloimpatiens sp. FM7315]|uniref:stage III sporulation protein AG n=1 Tax=Haloimpatiens sp. FM7315 TaxID=3298609 RepID=UPI0035A38870